MRVQKSERAREWDWFDVVHLNRQCVMPFISNNFLFRSINYILSLVVWSDRNFKIGDETDEMRYMHAKNRCTNILATVSAQWVQLRHIKCALLLVSLANLLIDTNKLVLPHKFSITDSRHCIDVFAQISIFICSIEACFRASVLPIPLVPFFQSTVCGKWFDAVENLCRLNFATNAVDLFSRMAGSSIYYFKAVSGTK